MLSSFRKINVSSAMMIIFIAWVLVYLLFLGRRELQGNEARRILPAQTMLTTGNWITPELAGQKYYKKPPMINWLIAISFKFFGDRSENSARMVSAIATLLICIFIIKLNYGIKDIQTRLIIAIIYLSSFGVINHGRVIEIEAAFTTLTGIATLWWLNCFSDNSRGFKLWLFPSVIIGLGLLMKGPIILMFFYVAVLCVLIKSKELKELISLPHIIGIIIMLGIFLSWTWKIHELNSPGNEVITTWKKEMLDEINPAKIDYAHWAKSVFLAIPFFLPWLILFPVAWSKEHIFETPLKENVFKSSRTALLIGFALVNIMPGTQARYSMPLLPLFAYVTGLSLSALNTNKTCLKMWRISILTINSIFMVLITLSVILIHSGLLNKILMNMKIVKSNAFFPMIPPMFSVSAMILIIGLFIGFTVLYYKNFLDNVLDLCVAILLQTVLFMFFFFIFVIPVENMFDKKRNFGKCVNEAVPENVPIYILDVKYQPFLYYIREPYHSIYSFDSISHKTDYVLMNNSTYADMIKDLKRNPFLFQGRQASEIRKIKYKRTDYHLVKFQENNSQNKIPNTR